MKNIHSKSIEETEKIAHDFVAALEKSAEQEQATIIGLYGETVDRQSLVVVLEPGHSRQQGSGLEGGGESIIKCRNISGICNLPPLPYEDTFLSGALFNACDKYFRPTARW